MVSTRARERTLRNALAAVCMRLHACGGGARSHDFRACARGPVRVYMCVCACVRACVCVRVCGCVCSLDENK